MAILKNNQLPAHQTPKSSKKKKKQRLKHRISAIATAEAAQSDLTKLQTKSDDALFVMDTTGDVGKRKAKVLTRSEKEEKRLAKLETSSTTLRKIRKMIKEKGVEGVVAMANKSNKKKERAADAGCFDLWDEGDGASTKKRKTKLIVNRNVPMSMAGTAPVVVTADTSSHLFAPAASNKMLKARKIAKLTARSKLAVETALPGQSYRPDGEQHQDVIGAALAIEVRRNDAVEEKNKPLAKGMSPDVLEIIVGSSDDESDSDSDDSGTDDGNNNNPATTPRKKREKLTRAQRNKQRRIRAERAAALAAKNEKRFLQSVFDTKKINKQLTSSAAASQEKREQIQKLKDEARAIPLGVNVFDAISERHPEYVPSLPVPLTEELECSNGGALRRVKPKGSLLTDRLASMAVRGMARMRTEQTKGAKKKMRIKPGKDCHVSIR